MKKYRLLIAVLLFVFLCSLQSSFSKILMKPYMQAVTLNSACVMVESDTKDDVNVEYIDKNDMKSYKAKTSFYVQTDKTYPTYMHRVFLNNLNPNSAYSYKANQGKSAIDGGEFHTAVPPGSWFRFAIMGDCRTDTSVHGLIARQIKKYTPYFSVYLGDLCFNNQYNTWKSEFFLRDELELITSVPFYNAVGNHEGWTQNTKAFQQAPESPSKKQEYYSFDYGDIHFLILNSVLSVNKGSEQYKFAADDLKSTTKKFKIVAFHHPAYCGGGYGNNAMMLAATNDIFEPNKVDIVLTGHMHFYQHNLVNGIHHLIVAGGGAPLYSGKKASFTLVYEKDYNYAIADFENNTLSIKVYNLSGDVLDKFELKK